VSGQQPLDFSRFTEIAEVSRRDRSGIRVGIRVSFQDGKGLIFVVGMTIRATITGFRMVPIMD
jgi:hypothetical protein